MGAVAAVAYEGAGYRVGTRTHASLDYLRGVPAKRKQWSIAPLRLVDHTKKHEVMPTSDRSGYDFPHGIEVIRERDFWSE
jgi:hypothetical protein